MIDFDIITILISTIILFIFIYIIKTKTEKNNMYILFFSIFYIYMIFVLKYTIFPIPVDNEYLNIIRQDSRFLNNINLIPFNFGLMDTLSYEQILLNILLTIPFGFGISFITKITKKKIIFLGISIGLIIEGLQLLIGLIVNYAYRYVDINDIIMNFIGTIIGYLLFILFSNIFTKIINNKDIELNNFLKYIYNVCESKKEEA
ncbi:VanZ family protein [Anaerosalibacter bizertensis]|nr:VanZ family protein [Anaerosalibacter bizertensis]MBV1821263.1 VanZ family protein [Bacteroidales bacterium MSK.15.36]MCB5560595.1 VanZ family protein [Anaerosalibacter bizertensis]MCG4566106.1 VanZ family protein [Anaerosalibacter bizertensis]MCG4583648.1 VanZ family protein [Anaerosalibacter bizertensis]MCG4586333.1 VanZ family protein [Anaerosalibacter bizertensis]